MICPICDKTCSSMNVSETRSQDFFVKRYDCHCIFNDYNVPSYICFTHQSKDKESIVKFSIHLTKLTLYYDHVFDEQMIIRTYPDDRLICIEQGKTKSPKDALALLNKYNNLLVFL